MPEAKEANSSSGERITAFRSRRCMVRWFRIALYIILGFAGQVAGTLLTRLYFEKGGSSKWMGTLIQVIGFPILLPYYCLSAVPRARKVVTTTNTDIDDVKITKPPSLLLRVCVYVYLGLLMAGNGYLFTLGFEYLPVSTISLISSSQLGFNAFFSYFLNSQKFTPFITNSLFLLTISSVLLVTNNSTERPPGVSSGKYILGFICTLLATAMNGLILASQQLVFRKVLKSHSIKSVMDVAVYQSLVASIATSIGYLASGEWKGLENEMGGFALGKTSYILTLVWTAVTWQVAIFSAVGLVFESSALFANVIGALGVPIAPIAALIVFRDKMNGVKGIAMVLAVWGFFSYVYQQYLDELDLKANKTVKPSEDQVSEA